MRAAVAQLEPGDDLLQDASDTLERSGVVTGEFGFAELYQERLDRMRDWLKDGSEQVRTFAQEQIRNLERRVAGETRRAEASSAARRLDYAEDIVDSE
ncbi:MAG TPA: hypothetical protein VGN97_06215 [Mesorhizobium sp.]|nr:hypothetical protein [Mesorhizobium sp.]